MKGFPVIDRLIVSQLLASFEGTSKSNAAQEQRAPTLWEICSKRAKVTPDFLKKCSIVVAAIAGAGCLFISMLVGLGVLLMSALVLILRAKRIERMRKDAIERDFPALLTSVASSVRAGIDPLRALCDAEAYFAPTSPFVEELQLFRGRLSAGDDEVAAIELLMVGEDNPDIELFKRCLVLSREHGSSLAEPLHRVTRVVRQRQSFRRKTRAALAMHRMSALGIALCAILIGAMQFIMNLSGVRIALESTVGTALLSGGGLLIVAGVWWMLMMGREERL